MSCSDTVFECGTHLLWVQNFNDLCDGPRVKCWDDAAARRQKLQLECLGVGWGGGDKWHSSENTLNTMSEMLTSLVRHPDDASINRYTYY